ncbi:MAG: diacylglycerol kinase [Clostridiales bacterium]
MKNKNLIESFNNAISGIIFTIKNERNMKAHIVVAVLILLLSLFYGLSKVEFLIICLTVSMVLVCELFNTAIEIVIDIIIDIYHPKAKIVKDVAAGAVLVASFFAVIVAYVIFFDKYNLSVQSGIRIIKSSPLHLMVITLLITVMTVFLLKAITKKGSFMQGGMPSGHSAIAISITTIIGLLIKDVNVITLCILLSLLVIESRLETKIHTVYEVFIGSVLGFFVTILLYKLFIIYVS